MATRKRRGASEPKSSLSGGVRSVERAGRILEALLSAAPRGLRLGEIAELTELHKSTALRLLRTLCDIGVISRSPDSERYRWDALHWLAVATKLRKSLAGTDAVQSLLDDLAMKSGETVWIAYPDITGRRTLLVAASVSRSPLRFDPGRVLSWPIHASAAGKVCLAYSRPEELESLRRAPLEATAPATITSFERLLAEVEETRSRGYGLAREEAYPGAFGVAVPVFDDGEKVTAALQLAAPIQRSTETNIERWLNLLREASQEATRLLYLANTVEGGDLPSPHAPRAEARAGVAASAEGRKKYRVV